MITKGNKTKNEQLGMSHGAACSKLRKQLLFKYVSLAGENFCYQCGEEIINIDEFTIEHKQPWLHESADLFWDMENIAFSHSICNMKAARRPMKNDSDTCKNGHIGKRFRAKSGSPECYDCKNDSRRARNAW